MTSHNKFSEPIYIDDLGWAAVAGGFPLEFFDDKDGAENKCFHINAAHERSVSERTKPLVEALEGLLANIKKNKNRGVGIGPLIVANKALESFKEVPDGKL
jgi:hypothetical protein